MTRIGAAAQRASPPPIAVWIEGRAATAEDTDSDPLVVGMLCRAHDLRHTVASIEDAFGDIERELDVTIEIRARTSADIEACTAGQLRTLRDAIPIVGAPPITSSSWPNAKAVKAVADRGRLTHAELDQRARLHAARIAELIRADPGIVDRARAQLARRMESPASAIDRTDREWERILRTMSGPRLRRFLVDPGERATRLRQSMPFLSALSDEQRKQLVDARPEGTRKRPR